MPEPRAMVQIRDLYCLALRSPLEQQGTVSLGFGASANLDGPPL